jgi:predicted aldo/keto reductase-like oxidoreductase
VLRTSGGYERQGVDVIERALELGITYCDTAPAYLRSQDFYGAVLRERRQGLFLASKTHDRSRDGSLRLLDDSLKRLKTDHLDLWQLHNLAVKEELDEIFAPDGAIHALMEAKRDGRVRHIGITGHYDPAVLNEAMRRHEFDTLLVALNVADRHRLSFIEHTVPRAAERQMGIIGMKVAAKGRLLQPGMPIDMRQALGYVLNLPVSTVIVGFDTPRHVEEAVRIAKAFRPLAADEVERLETLAKSYVDEISYFKRA